MADAKWSMNDRRSSENGASCEGSLPTAISAGHIMAHCRGNRQAQSSQSKILQTLSYGIIDEEHKYFIPGNVEIIVNKNIHAAEVSVHQWKREGVQGRYEIPFFGHGTIDQAINRVE